MACCPKLRNSLTRKKPAEMWLSDTALRRCLTLLDLTSLGVGTIVGAGLYVVIGELARDIAGPAVVLSFLLASASALLCTFSYAEYGCRIPKAGSAYLYTYVTLGEIWAFIVGWNIILEFILAGASLARSCSAYIDSVFMGQIYRFFMDDIASWNLAGIGPFPDFLASALVIAMVAIVCLGVRSSSNVQKAVTAVNLAVVVFMVICGMFFSKVENWSNSFLPYGVGGVLQGAASAFFAFAGLDVVAAAAEEAVNPGRNIPLSLLFIVSISTLAYFGVATVLTLMLPYTDLNAFAPLAGAFAHSDFPEAKYIVDVGGICATISALLCAVYTTPRIVYSMASDGLLFKWLSHVHDRTHVPVRATICGGLFMSVLALIFDVKQLVELLSIGTLIAYTMVAISVLISRYQPGVQSVPYDDAAGKRAKTATWLQTLHSAEPSSQITYQPIGDNKEALNGSKEEANERSAYRAKLSVLSLVCGIVGLAIVLTRFFQHLFNGEWWAIFLSCLFGGIVVASLVAIQQQPRNCATFPFMVPCVPYIPAASIFINTVLIVNLDWWTYVRFGVWMTLGVVIYVLYGYRFSREAVKGTHEQEGEFVLQQTPDIQHSVDKPQLQ